MFADVRVLSGEAKETMAVPVSAILDEAGESVVYVEQGGESFERRPLELGGRDGDFVEVLSGLSPGERVVTKGAYYIRLASSSGAVPAHGHAH
jgi:multidrug efflux pump subunit AcrA (membrane-fusion protein)